MATKLPTYKGYTVDFRLSEFRKAGDTTYGMGIEFIPFYTQEGDKLLAELIEGKGGKDLKAKAMNYMRERG